MWLSEITLQLIGFRVAALLIITGIHGGIAAGAAVLLGDKGPRYDGRLTIMPTQHLDFVGAIGLTVFGLGWAKPMAIDGGQFRIGRVGLIIPILAGFIGLLLTAAFFDALILPALTMLPLTAGLTMAAFLRAASSLSIWCALLSLIPIPPLASGMLLSGFGIHVSRQAKTVLAILLLAAVATGVVHQLLGPAHTLLALLMFGE